MSDGDQPIRDGSQGPGEGKRPDEHDGATSIDAADPNAYTKEQGATALVDSSPGRLSHLRAAQLRRRVIRAGLVRLAFGTVFLIGALAHALSPQRHEQSSLFWTTMLSMLSTINVGWGVRALARVRSRGNRAWLVIAGVWGVLAIALLGLLLRR